MPPGRCNNRTTLVYFILMSNFPTSIEEHVGLANVHNDHMSS